MFLIGNRFIIYLNEWTEIGIDIMIVMKMIMEEELIMILKMEFIFKNILFFFKSKQILIFSKINNIRKMLELLRDL